MSINEAINEDMTMTSAKEEHQEEGDGSNTVRGGKAPDDDSDASFSQSQALPVADGVPDFEHEPTTAEEYLVRVRWEAQQCPQVVRVEFDESTTPHQQGSHQRCGQSPPPPPPLVQQEQHAAPLS